MHLWPIHNGGMCSVIFFLQKVLFLCTVWCKADTQPHNRTHSAMQNLIILGKVLNVSSDLLYVF